MRSYASHGQLTGDGGRGSGSGLHGAAARTDRAQRIFRPRPTPTWSTILPSYLVRHQLRQRGAQFVDWRIHKIFVCSTTPPELEGHGG